MVEVKIILEGVVGSHAYGLNHADSDIDTAGIFVEPTSSVLGLYGFKESIVHNDGTDKTTDPDVSYHEVGKFIRLAIAGNPTVSELLWLPEHTKLEVEGRWLVEHRDLFLSQAVRKTYGGYARQQFKRLQERGDFSSTLKNRTAKHAKHMTRLILQGTQVLQEGTLRVRLTASEALVCKTMGDMAADNQDEFIEVAEIMLSEFDTIKSDLPMMPDIAPLNELLLAIRARN